MTTATSKPFSPTEAVRYGWQKATDAPKILLPIAAVGAVLALIQSGFNRAGGSFSLLAFAVHILQWAVTLAFLRVALELHDGKPVDAWNLRHLLAGFLPFLLTHVLYGLLVAAGMLLLIVPGILFAARFGFATWLVVDQKRDPIAALHESWRLTAGRTWLLVKLGLLLLAVNLLGAMALGIGLLLTIPISFMAVAYAFRRLQAQPHQTTASTPLIPTPASA